MKTQTGKALLFLGLIAVLILANTIYKGVNTINCLDVVESERDQWQRSDVIIRALNLRHGSFVVDLGSGAGYFALKLSPEVGKGGRVLAVDIRRLSLLFLWLRSQLRNQHNVSVVHVQPEQPELPPAVDAVLVANTYHEFRDPKSMVDHMFRALAPGGRLVIADRGSDAAAEGDPHDSNHHDVPLASVEIELSRRGFEIVSRDERFINQPGRDRWWLLVARKPD